MNARLKLSLWALMVLAAFTLSPATQAQEEEPENLPPDKWAEAPSEMVSAFVKAVKGTKSFQFADALKREKLEPEIEKWKADAGVDVSVRWQNFLLVHLYSSDREVKIPEKGEWFLQLHQTWEGQTQRQLLILVNRGGSKGFRISAAALKELELQYVETVFIRRVLNRIVGRYSVQNEQLSTVVAALCKEASGGRGNVDYVVRTDPGSQVQISLQMSGRTVFECLQLVARSIGWEVYVNPINEHTINDSPTTMFLDFYVNWKDAHELWTNRDFLNMRDQIQPAIATPLDAIREGFQRKVKEALGERFVVMLKPAKEK